ncbi:MAG: IS21-like element helper ATPase IstB [Acidobacteriota bacterium]|nr:IS21-like element helper ATPase IstB [Acidobacteriota bacterium]
MLANHTLDQLRALKLTGMADAFVHQLEQPSTHELAFNERFALLVDRETTHRDNRRLTRLLQLAHLKQPACVEDIDYKHQRGLERSQMSALATCDWIRAHHNLHITAPTGCGKSWIACALGNQACRQGFSVRYERTSRLLDSLRVARGDGSYGKRLIQLAKTEVLILDDFGLKPLTQQERHDLLEMIEDRHGARSTLITSQLPVSSWHEYLNDPTVADALLDRLLSQSHRLELKGESMRPRAAA